MKHTTTYTESDYLTHQLYEASTNPKRTVRRKRDYIGTVIVIILFTIASYLRGDYKLFYIGAFFAALALFFGKEFLRWRYKKHFIKHVKNTFGSAINELVQVEITDEFLIISERTGETTIKISEITRVCELPDHFLITITTGPTLIIPKISAEFKEDIAKIARRENMVFLDETDWKWR